MIKLLFTRPTTYTFFRIEPQQNPVKTHPWKLWVNLPTSNGLKKILKIDLRYWVASHQIWTNSTRLVSNYKFFMENPVWVQNRGKKVVVQNLIEFFFLIDTSNKLTVSLTSPRRDKFHHQNQKYPFSVFLEISSFTFQINEVFWVLTINTNIIKRRASFRFKSQFLEKKYVDV